MKSHHRRDWEDLADVDPLWAILSDPARRFGNWNVDAFFETGSVEFRKVMQIAARLRHPIGRDRALDFGCGVGRVTRAMSQYFNECTGVDISETMIAKARELNAGFPGCKFIRWNANTFDVFADNFFDAVYSNIVLQHLPTRSLIELKISEFVRILKPGGLVMFQLLSFIPVRYRIQPTRRAYGLLRALGFSHDFLYKRLRLTPIRSNYIPEARILEILEKLKTKCLEIQRSTMPDTSVRSCTYWVTK